jgi:anti-anti-sigma regulatory factor
MSALVTASTGTDDGTWLVTLHGDHDLATRSELVRETSAIWALCRVAIIDLSAAGFIDSGVIRWLLDVERQLEESDASTLSIVEGPPGCAAARLFELLRMRHVLACYPTLEDALAQARSSKRDASRSHSSRSSSAGFCATRSSSFRPNPPSIGWSS